MKLAAASFMAFIISLAGALGAVHSVTASRVSCIPTTEQNVSSASFKSQDKSAQVIASLDHEHGHDGSHKDCGDCRTCHHTFNALSFTPLRLTIESVAHRISIIDLGVTAPDIEGLRRPPLV